MKATRDVLFLSLKPEFAEMIISGDKTVELRRIRPRALPGTLVLVYASSPVMKLIGTCIVQEISVGTPREIWRIHGASTGVNRSGLVKYFHDTERGVAISVGTPKRFGHPIPLTRVREHLGDSLPPQSFRYISIRDAIRLIREGSSSRVRV